jgi:hypothetical protein
LVLWPPQCGERHGLTIGFNSYTPAGEEQIHDYLQLVLRAGGARVVGAGWTTQLSGSGSE